MPRVKHPITNEIMSVRGAESFWAVDPGTGKKSKYLIADYRLDGKGTPFVEKPSVEKPPAEKPEKPPAEKPEKPPAVEMPPEPPEPPEKKTKKKVLKTLDKPWYKKDWFF